MLNSTILRRFSLLKSCLPVGTEPKAPFVIEVFKCSQTQQEQEKNEGLYVLKVRLFPVQTSEASSSCKKKKKKKKNFFTVEVVGNQHPPPRTRRRGGGGVGV